MQQKKELTMGERVHIMEQTISSIGRQLREDGRNTYYNREHICEIINTTIEAVTKPVFAYAFMVRITDDTKREIGAEQAKMLIKDIFETVQTLLVSEATAECGAYDDTTMLIICEEDLSAKFKQHITNTLYNDYDGLEGLFYSVGGTNTVKNDSLSAVIARLEYAIKKTDNRKNEVFILTSK
jgi:hypothetical protein